MQTVPHEVIQQTWDNLCELDEKASAQFSKEFFKAQPALSIYCAAQYENLGPQGEHSAMAELTMAIWQAMTRVAGRPLPIATPEEIGAAEAATTRQLETLEEGSEMDLQTYAGRLVKNHNQRDLLAFGIGILMSRYEAEPDLAADSLGLEMIWLNTVVDCLDKLDPNAPRRTELEVDLENWPELDLSGSEPPQPAISKPKVGRNDPCPCGSGKKYKKCCFGKSA